MKVNLELREGYFKNNRTTCVIRGGAESNIRAVHHAIAEFEKSNISSKSQHAYLKGKSTETALHEVIGTVERSLQYKQYTLAAFLDIEGAFNNVSTNVNKEALTGIGLEGYLTHWIISMLSTRIIQSDLGGNHLTRAVNRGTRQGGAI